MTSGPLQPVGIGFLLLLSWAAWTDLRHRRIQNLLVLGLLALWLGATALERAVSWFDPAGALLVLLVGGLMWRRGLLGGGDVKLLAVLALWFGAGRLGLLLLGTGLAAGVVALGQMALARRDAFLPAPLLRYVPFPPAPAAPASLPLGLAIGIAASVLWLAPAL